MTTQLTPLEQDIIGDIAQDSHGVGELAGYYRAAHPGAPDADVFAFVRSLLATWISRGWLQLGPGTRERAGLENVAELLPFLDYHGPSAVSLDSTVRLPEIDLTDQAHKDVEWLRDAI
jgi:hypothetical protein